MTQYSKLISIPVKDKKVKETRFKYFLGNLEDAPQIAYQTPKNYDNVIFIGHDSLYGDVFKCYYNDPNHFVLCFGEKGDEFDD